MTSLWHNLSGWLLGTPRTDQTNRTSTNTKRRQIPPMDIDFSESDSDSDHDLITVKPLEPVTLQKGDQTLQTNPPLNSTPAQTEKQRPQPVPVSHVETLPCSVSPHSYTQRAQTTSLPTTGITRTEVVENMCLTAPTNDKSLLPGLYPPGELRFGSQTQQQNDLLRSPGLYSHGITVGQPCDMTQTSHNERSESLIMSQGQFLPNRRTMSVSNDLFRSSVPNMYPQGTTTSQVEGNLNQQNDLFRSRVSDPYYQTGTDAPYHAPQTVHNDVWVGQYGAKVNPLGDTTQTQRNNAMTTKAMGLGAQTFTTQSTTMQHNHRNAQTAGYPYDYVTSQGMVKTQPNDSLRPPTSLYTHSNTQLPHIQTPPSFLPHDGSSDRQVPNRVQRREKDPMRFNGRTDWPDYLRHFDAVAKWNYWNYDECGLQLAICLIDEAREVLSCLPAHLQNDYDSLKSALTSRYSPAGKESQYAHELMNRTCRSDETVTAFGQNLRRLASKAYADKVDDRILLSLFIKGLPDKGMQKHVHFSKPSTLADAICLASEYECFDRPSETKASSKMHKPRDTMISPVEQTSKSEDSRTDKALTGTLDSMMNVLRDLGSKINQMGNKQSHQSYPKQSSFKGDCFSCHERGHIQRFCPNKKRQPNKTSGTATTKPTLN